MHNSIYEPREDTYMLVEQVRKFSKGKVLDMGTGSGILAFEAQAKAKFVVALDINPEAVKFTQNLAILKNMSNVLVKDSNLFSFLDNNFVEYDKKNKKFKFKYYKDKRTRFDTIIFNPPYLPRRRGEDLDVELYVAGGKHGYEVIEEFLDQVNNFLEANGNVMLVFSNLTKKNKVDEVLARNLLEFELLSTKELFMEELYCYRVYKSDFLKLLEKKGLKNIYKFTHGHRGNIYVGNYNGKKIVVKKQRLDKDATNTINNEISYLKKLNKVGIGPKVLFSGKDYFAYNFIDGVFIKDFILNQRKGAIKDVFVKVFKKMYKLDKLGIDKEEMHHPKKHVVIDKHLKVYLIDFERANKSEKPKNVTQFVQYVASIMVSDRKKDKIRSLAKEYKKDMSLTNFKKIIDFI